MVFFLDGEKMIEFPYLSQPDGRWGVPVLLIMTLRYTVQAVVMAVALAPRGRAGFASVHPKFQWLRGLLLLATSFFSFFAVRFMPVPEYTAISMLLTARRERTKAGSAPAGAH